MKNKKGKMKSKKQREAKKRTMVTIEKKCILVSIFKKSPVLKKIPTGI